MTTGNINIAFGRAFCTFQPREVQSRYPRWQDWVS